MDENESPAIAKDTNDKEPFNKNLVVVPAIAVVVVGVICLFAAILRFVVAIGIFNGFEYTNERHIRGVERFGSVLYGHMLLWPALFSWISAWIIIAGGVQMARFRSHSFTMCSSLLMTIQLCTGVWIFSAPVGIWAFLVLNRHKTKDHFLT